MNLSPNAILTPPLPPPLPPSGGEKQRVSIARCLLKNPPIVLFDEASSALDTRTERRVQDALDALGKNRTSIIIAHRLTTIRHASQIIVLDNGRVAEMGSHEELLAIGQIYAELWGMQNQRGDPRLEAPTDASVVNLDEAASSGAV